MASWIAPSASTYGKATLDYSRTVNLPMRGQTMTSTSTSAPIAVSTLTSTSQLRLIWLKGVPQVEGTKKRFSFFSFFLSMNAVAFYSYDKAFVNAASGHITCFCFIFAVKGVAIALITFLIFSCPSGLFSLRYFLKL